MLDGQSKYKIRTDICAQRTGVCSVGAVLMLTVGNAAAQDAGCVEVDEEGGPGSVRAQMMGRVASFYYLKHATMAHLSRALRPGMPLPEVGALAAALLCDVPKDRIPLPCKTFPRGLEESSSSHNMSSSPASKPHA